MSLMLSLLNLAALSVNFHCSLALPWGPLLTSPGSVHLPGSVSTGSQDGSGPELEASLPARLTVPLVVPHRPCVSALAATSDPQLDLGRPGPHLPAFPSSTVLLASTTSVGQKLEPDE